MHRQEFLMTQSEMNDIIAINKNQMPVMKIGDNWSGLDLQEKINAYWKTLGAKYGFEPRSARPCSRGKLYFLAIPKKAKA